jgi:hypothetical protein
LFGATGRNRRNAHCAPLTSTYNPSEARVPCDERIRWRAAEFPPSNGSAAPPRASPKLLAVKEPRLEPGCSPCMRARLGAAITASVAAAAVVLGLTLPGDSPPRRAPAVPAAVGGTGPAPGSRDASSRSGREGCSTRSEASFPGAFTDPRNLVVGPLVLVGGAHTPASTVRDFGGNKFPLLVRSGHTVTVRLAQRGRRSAGLAYGQLPQGETKLRDTYRTVTFVACRPAPAPKEYRAEGPSGSYADGVAVTFWSGFVLAAKPACIPLDVYIDDERSPRRVWLPLGRSCNR